MMVFNRIKQKIYNFFHPSFQDILCRFGIVEDMRMSEEDEERCIEMIEQKREEIMSGDTSGQNEDSEEV